MSYKKVLQILLKYRHCINLQGNISRWHWAASAWIWILWTYLGFAIQQWAFLRSQFLQENLLSIHTSNAMQCIITGQAIRGLLILPLIQFVTKKKYDHMVSQMVNHLHINSVDSGPYKTYQKLNLGLVIKSLIAVKSKIVLNINFNHSLLRAHWGGRLKQAKSSSVDMKRHSRNSIIISSIFYGWRKKKNGGEKKREKKCSLHQLHIVLSWVEHLYIKGAIRSLKTGNTNLGDVNLGSRNWASEFINSSIGIMKFVSNF